MRPTVKEVAARAGVSVTTVHRVLSANGYVHQATKGKVIEAATALDYRPNAIAQSLRRKRTGVIGHIVHSVYPNPFFACVSVGVEDATRAIGLTTVTCNTHGSIQAERDYAELLLRQRVDGVIFTVPLSEDTVRLVQESGVPVCIIERPRRLSDVDVVLADNFSGARDAVSYLLKLGHRTIGYIGEEPNDNVETERFAGYCQALAEYGVERREALVRFIGQDGGGGPNAMLDLLRRPERPTAVFAAGDLLAMGALQALWEHGLRVPQDLSIVGFDDTLASLASPPLTTVALPMLEMGAAGVDLIVSRSNAERHLATRKVILPTCLIVRSSSTSWAELNPNR